MVTAILVFLMLAVMYGAYLLGVFVGGRIAVNNVLKLCTDALEEAGVPTGTCIRIAEIMQKKVDEGFITKKED